MKRILTLLLILNFIFIFNGCARRDINDTNDMLDNDINDDFLDDNIPEANPNFTGYNNDYITGNGNGIPNNYNDDSYTTSLQRIDDDLRAALGNVDNMRYDVNDDDYLVRSRGSYTARANAYKTALNAANRLNYSTNNRDYHDTIVSYYQTGYDKFNDLSTRYGGFTNMDDETTFRNEVGETYFDVDNNVRRGYEDALRSLNITRYNGRY